MNIPIKTGDCEECKRIIDLVDEIYKKVSKNVQSVDKNESVISGYEKQIDHFVYKLYGLTYEEIENVKNSSK